MQHGLNNSSFSYVCEGADSLAFFFAEAGFDVWLNNNRGNLFSRGHKYLDRKKDAEEYFSFSIEELGRYDQPGLIDYIRELTGQEKVTYSGHSAGGSQILCGLADRPSYYQDAVNLFLLTAPQSRIDLCLNENIEFLMTNMEKTAQEPGMPSEALLRKTAWVGSEDKLIKYMMDVDPKKCTDIGKHVIGGHMVGGTSRRSAANFNQMVKAKKFQKYDFGPEGNIKKYGSETAPEIDLKSFSNAPIAMFCGSEDLLVSPKGYHWLKDQL